jgi:hypothetical protein
MGLIPHKLMSQIKRNTVYRAFVYSPVVKWFVDNRNVIAKTCYLLWVAGMCYWMYKFAGVEAKPYKMASLFAEDDALSARTALAYIFLAATSGVIVVMMAIFIVKFAINIIWGLVGGVFSVKWHYLLSTIVLLISLFPCFSHIREIKSVCLALKLQCTDIVENAQQFDFKLKMNKHPEGEKESQPETSSENSR